MTSIIPLNGRSGLDEISSEILRFINNRCPADLPRPLDVEGDGCRYRSYRWNCWIHETVPAGQIVCKIVRVGDGQIFDMHRNPRRIELDFKAVWMNWDCPKQSIRSDRRGVISDRRGVIVDLCGDGSLSNWTGVDIESYKPEYSLMLIAIFSDVLAFHEAQVGLKGQFVGKS